MAVDVFVISRRLNPAPDAPFGINVNGNTHVAVRFPRVIEPAIVKVTVLVARGAAPMHLHREKNVSKILVHFGVFELLLLNRQQTVRTGARGQRTPLQTRSGDNQALLDPMLHPQ